MNGKYRCFLIRHGETDSNLEKRYLGCGTDEPLCEKAFSSLDKLSKVLNGMAEFENMHVLCGPMKRCVQTAEYLFGGKDIEIVRGLTEMDFGLLEGKNYIDLSGNPDYQRWIDEGGTGAFPGGENREEFIGRTIEALRPLIKDTNFLNSNSMAIVCHGGNIMALMSTLTGKDYFDFQVPCGDGYEVVFDINGECIDVYSYDRLCGRFCS